MPKSIFSAPHFTDETAAYAFVEAHLWPDGAVCPRCGSIGRCPKGLSRSQALRLLNPVTPATSASRHFTGTPTRSLHARAVQLRRGDDFRMAEAGGVGWP